MPSAALDIAVSVRRGCDEITTARDRLDAGLATWLVASALTHPALAGLRRVLLVTRDAHAVYARCGFVPLARPERFMEINRPDVYRDTWT